MRVSHAEESDRANSAQILSCEFHTAREVLDKFFGAKNSRMASSSAEYDAFLTHDWGDDELGRSNHARVAEVNRLLKAAGFVTWFDEDRMQGDIVSQMANGIDSSAAVLVFVTENYCIKVAGAGRNGADDNCKKEFDYASRRKGIEKMIAAVMEPRCRDPTKWQGAVGMTLGGRLYKDLAEDDVAAGVQALME